MSESFLGSSSVIVVSPLRCRIFQPQLLAALCRVVASAPGVRPGFSEPASTNRARMCFVGILMGNLEILRMMLVIFLTSRFRLAFWTYEVVIVCESFVCC